MNLWVLQLSMDLAAFALGTYLLLAVRPRLPPPARQDVTPRPAPRVPGRLMGTGETLADPMGRRCLLIRSRVTAMLEDHVFEIVDIQSVPAELHDETGTYPIDLARCQIVPEAKPDERSTRELWSYTPELAKLLLAARDLPEAIRANLDAHGAASPDARFFVSRTVVEHGAKIRRAPDVATPAANARDGEHAGYRDAAGPAVLGRTSDQPPVLYLAGAPEEHEPAKPRSYARLHVTLVGALLTVQAAAGLAILANLYLSAR